MTLCILKYGKYIKQNHTIYKCSITLLTFHNWKKDLFRWNHATQTHLNFRIPKQHWKILNSYKQKCPFQIPTDSRCHKGIKWRVKSYFSDFRRAICESFFPRSTWSPSTTDCSCEWEDMTASRVAAISLLTALASSRFFWRLDTWKYRAWWWFTSK